MKKYGSGDTTRKRRLTELSFLYATLRIDLRHDPTKYHFNISNGCGVMGYAPETNCWRPPSRPPADVHHINNQSFPLENLANNVCNLKNKTKQKKKKNRRFFLHHIDNLRRTNNVDPAEPYYIDLRFLLIQLQK